MPQRFKNVRHFKLPLSKLKLLIILKLAIIIIVLRPIILRNILGSHRLTSKPKNLLFFFFCFLCFLKGCFTLTGLPTICRILEDCPPNKRPSLLVEGIPLVSKPVIAPSGAFCSKPNNKPPKLGLNFVFCPAVRPPPPNPPTPPKLKGTKNGGCLGMYGGGGGGVSDGTFLGISDGGGLGGSEGRGITGSEGRGIIGSEGRGIIGSEGRGIKISDPGNLGILLRTPLPLLAGISDVKRFCLGCLIRSEERFVFSLGFDKPNSLLC